eukprot:TRINITY_DN4634_c0_g2_i3.p1 TRINITY_DN4634_c0_g2~~TRINITY_DN4634_c0_g2_i3.p1  ORF type:complete len:377 (+),score=57.23 TRINITY_DN4634_c0_g2_i3:2-1132(+)
MHQIFEYTLQFFEKKQVKIAWLIINNSKQLAQIQEGFQLAPVKSNKYFLKMRSIAGQCSESNCHSIIRGVYKGGGGSVRQRSPKFCRVFCQRENLSSDGSKRRVVVTGMSVVSPLGHDVDEFYNNLLEGRSGITKIEGFDSSDFSCQVAGEIKAFESNGYILPKWERRIDKCIKYTLISGKKALEDAGVQWDSDKTFQDLDPLRCGILIGSAMGGFTAFTDAVTALANSGHRKMNPFCIPFSITNMGGAMLAMDLGFMGPNYPISTACATGNHCILSAAEFIQRNQADVMLAGASDAAITPAGIGGFIACKALSKRNDSPEAASRPWDVERGLLYLYQSNQNTRLPEAQRYTQKLQEELLVATRTAQRILCLAGKE